MRCLIENFRAVGLLAASKMQKFSIKSFIMYYDRYKNSDMVQVRNGIFRWKGSDT